MLCPYSLSTGHVTIICETQQVTFFRLKEREPTLRLAL